MAVISVLRKPTNVIRAIKSLRELTEWGLIESKRAIESQSFHVPAMMQEHVPLAIVKAIVEAGGDAVVGVVTAEERVRGVRPPRGPTRRERLITYRLAAAVSLVGNFIEVNQAWAALVEERAQALLAAERSAKKSVKEASKEEEEVSKS